MKIKFNRTGTERKALVTAMGEILEVKPRYLGMPTANYEVDYFTIDKNGTVEFDDRADSKEVKNLLDRLAERGFIAEATDEEIAEVIDSKTTANADSETSEDLSNESEEIGLTVSIPIENVAVGKLTTLLETKGELIKKALGIENLPIEVSEDTVSFPWFSTLPDAETVKAYTHFISALCKMSREQKRINAVDRPIENDKYAFRCFLLRLGFIGKDYKMERKILLKNLTGSSAFKSKAPMQFPSREVVEQVRQEYPVGTKVRLLEMSDRQAPPVGTIGVITGVDDTASLLVKWQNGSGLNCLFGIDKVEKISE